MKGNGFLGVLLLAIVAAIVLVALSRGCGAGADVSAMSVSGPMATKQAQQASKAELDTRASQEAYSSLVLNKRITNLLPGAFGVVALGLIAGWGYAQVRKQLKRGNVHPANNAGQYGIQEVRDGNRTVYRNLDAMVTPSTTFEMGRVGQMEPSSIQAQTDVRLGLLMHKNVTAASRSGEMVRRQELHERLAERLGWGKGPAQPAGPNDIIELAAEEAETHLIESGVLQGGNHVNESGATRKGAA